jgi:hypothetical protein
MRSSINQSTTVILVGLVSCLLTSMTGIAAVMLSYGWSQSGGGREWLHRLSIAYPAASIVVVAVFPWLVPWLAGVVERYFTKSGQPQSL